MGVILFDQVTKCYGDNLILDKISFELFENEKVALIGKNGSGKSTIFNMIEGSLDFDDGTIHIQNGYSIAYLKQIHDDQVHLNGLEMLHSAFNSIDELQEMMNQAHHQMAEQPLDENLIKAYGRLHDKFEFMGGYNIKEKVSKIITGLNIPEKVLQTPFINLSGGEQTTIMLGKSLLTAPDVLLLDEPTNHLDMNSCMWLENYINKYKGTVLYVSHDRYFINKTAMKVIDLSQKKAKTYKGNYEAYLLQKQQDEERNLKLYERQGKEIERLSATARQMRSYGTEIAIKRAKNLEKRIEQMDKVDKPVDEKTLSFAFKEVAKSSYEVVKLKNISKTFEDNKVLDQINLLIKNDEKVGVIGPNGAGKSTLIKIITDNLKPDTGEVKIGKSIKYAYLEQEVLFSHDRNTVLEEVCDQLKLTIQSGRNILGKYLFSGDDVFKKIYTLSGGEKSRLRLLLEMQNDINLLILDEPTNHLDIPSREELEDAITMFHGTMLFISHDRHFINKFAKKIVQVNNGDAVVYDGNYDFYVKEVEEQKNVATIKKEKPIKVNNSYGKNKRRAVTMIKKIEKNIKEHEHDITVIDEEIAVTTSDYKRLTELTIKREENTKAIEQLMDEWLLLNEDDDENN